MARCVIILPMNTEQQTPMWKKALNWIALALASVVVLDWLLGGRLRARLPFRRPPTSDPV